MATRMAALIGWAIDRTRALVTQIITPFWISNSGTWQWLSEDSRSLPSLNKALWRGAIPSANFYLMLFLSSVVCTLGLLANSAAVIIGAMIITPLLNPVIGIAFSIVIHNRRLFKRASLTLGLGILLAIINSAVICRLLGLQNLGTEILIRSEPTLLDLVVATAAGAAGAFANARLRVGSALPGVAIAVALLPPISVVGIGLSLNSYEIMLGAILLFATNLTGIVFGGGITFLVGGYGTLARAKHSLAIAIILLTILGVPLGFSFRHLLIAGRTEQHIEHLLRERYAAVSTIDVRRIEVDSLSRGQIHVFVELVAPEGTIRDIDRRRIEQQLEEELGGPASLRMRIIPSLELAPASDQQIRQPLSTSQGSSE